jgi:hypothetical protein
MTTPRPLTVFLIILLIFVAIVAIEIAVYSDTLSWQPNPDPRVQYKVYIGTEHRNYNRVVDVGTSTTWRLDIVEPDDYYFAVTSRINDQIESAYSYEIFYPLFLRPPDEFKLLPD